MANLMLCGDCSEQNNSESIMTTLNKFVQAVDLMDETVMIPSRLKDMEVTATNAPEIKEENNNKALVPIASQGTDLYDFYTLLKTIKTDLTMGSSSLEPSNGVHEGEVNSSKDSANHAATAFRFHLQGLFSVLRQMTETANYLTNRYESEVQDNSRNSLSSFAI